MKLPAVFTQRIMLGIVSLAAGALAVVLVRNTISQERRAVERERQRMKAEYRAPISVVVVAKDIAQGETLDDSHLRMADVPEEFAQPYAVRATAQVVGLVTAAPLAEGEQVLTNKLRRPDEVVPQGNTLSDIVPKGKRAVTIAVDQITGVGGFVRPGDHVDVLWTVQVPGESGKSGDLVTLTLFQDVPVYAIGGEIVGRQARKGRDREADVGGAQQIVTLAMTPQEISFLLFAREQGQIQLSLRPQAEDQSQVAVAPASAATFNAFIESQFGVQTAPPTAATAAPPQKTAREVEVYKGLKKDVVLLPDADAPAP